MEAASQVLFDSLRTNESLSANSRGCNWDTVWTMARDHCLVPYLYRRWTESGFMAGLPASISSRFSIASSNNAKRNLRLLAILDEIKSALEARGIPILISKGLPVSQSCYGSIDLRVHYDIDLQIRTKDGDAAIEALRPLGYIPFFAKIRFQREQCLLWRPKPYCWNADGIFDPEAPCFLELHTKPWEPHWHGFQMDCNLDLWEGARFQSIAGVQVRVPAEERLLVHLAVHYACNVLETTARLMHLLDIILLLRLRGDRLRWDKVLADINNSSAASFCFLTFEMARRIGDVRFPGAFWETLRRSTPSRICSWLEIKGVEDCIAMNMREPHQSLIYFLHWNMAETWADRIRVLLYSLRTPYREHTGISRWISLGRRMVRRLRCLARELQNHRGQFLFNSDRGRHLR